MTPKIVPAQTENERDLSLAMDMIAAAVMRLEPVKEALQPASFNLPGGFDNLPGPLGVGSACYIGLESRYLLENKRGLAALAAELTARAGAAEAAATHMRNAADLINRAIMSGE